MIGITYRYRTQVSTSWYRLSMSYSYKVSTSWYRCRTRICSSKESISQTIELYNYIIRYLEPNFTTLGHFKILRNLRILQLFLNFFTSLQSIFCLKISRYNFFQKLAGSNTKKSSLCRKNDTDRHPGIDTTRRIDYF